MVIVEKLKARKDEPKRYVCFMKCETTGVFRGAPVTKVDIVRAEHKDLFEGVERRTWLFNPGVPVADEALRAGGLTREEVENAPVMTESHIKEIIDFTDDADIVAWHPSFDISHLLDTFLSKGVKHNFLSVNTISEREAARKRMGDVEKYTFADALAKTGVGGKTDADGVYRLWLDLGDFYCEPTNALFEKFSTGLTVDGFVGVRQGMLCFRTGKHQGELIHNQPDYCKWLVQKSDMSLDTKRLVAAYLKEYEKDIEEHCNYAK